MAIRLFPADGVTWVVSLPTGLAADTVWPVMDWVEALAPLPGPPSDKQAETRPRKEVHAA
ncbi:MAG: hypothetical protein GX624_09430 [Actinobacteria bacterium]|nr:hypothetical protein [Actinomycetota bacterium]